MSPIIRFHIRLFQLFGHFNVSFNADPKGRFLTERILLYWTTLLACIYAALTINTFVSSEPYLFSGDTFGYFNDAFKVVISEFTIIIIYFESTARRDALKKFWDLFYSLPSNAAVEKKKKLSCLALIRPHSRFLIIFYGIAVMELGVELLFVLLQPFTRHLIFFWSMFVPYIYAAHLRNMQFILHTEIIRQELVNLELDLGLLVDYTRFTKAFDGFDEFLRRNIVEKQKVTSEILCQREHFFLSLLFDTVLERCNNNNVNVYERIYGMFENFQKYFGFSMIAVLLMVYVRVLVDAYFMYYCSYRGYLHMESFLIVPAFFEIPAFLITSKNCMNRVKYITYQLHNIMCRVDGTVTLQIQNFSLQILHQRIRIDGIGITTLDGYMLCRALGSLTTYMIFFIQFMPKFRSTQTSNN